MYAIIQMGSSQFKVAEGDVIEGQRVVGEEGKKINIDKVLLFAKGSDIRIGQPYLKDVKVNAKIIKHQLGKKVSSFKYRRRKDSSSKVGHREKNTAISIEKIVA